MASLRHGERSGRGQAPGQWQASPHEQRPSVVSRERVEELEKDLEEARAELTCQARADCARMRPSVASADVRSRCTALFWYASLSPRARRVRHADLHDRAEGHPRAPLRAPPLLPHVPRGGLHGARAAGGGTAPTTRSSAASSRLVCRLSLAEASRPLPPPCPRRPGRLPAHWARPLPVLPSADPGKAALPVPEYGTTGVRSRAERQRRQRAVITLSTLPQPDDGSCC